MGFLYKELRTPTVGDLIEALSWHNPNDQLTFEMGSRNERLSVSPIKHLGRGYYTATICSGSYENTVYVGLFDE